jgi:Zn-dependent protease
MKWSWPIGHIAGIQIRIHATFPLLLVWVAWSRWALEESLSAAVQGMMLVLVVFGIVILHELGHALMARRFGISTPDITLLPIGGLARLERMPDEPRQELLVALAGPAVNVVLAVALAVVLLALGQPFIPLDPLEPHVPFLAQLLWINVVLAVFNLIPAFPMDGGRALRALLAMRLPPVRATEVAARLGQSIALAFGLVGLMVNPLLALIALFVWMGAGAEAKLARMKLTMEGMTVDQVMARELWVARPHEPLSAITDRLLAGFQTDFPVVEGGQVVGMLTHANVLATLTERGPMAPVAEAMTTKVYSARSDEPLVDAFERLLRSRISSMPVIDDGVLVGMLRVEAVTELMSIRAAMDAAQLRAQRVARRSGAWPHTDRSVAWTAPDPRW